MISPFLFAHNLLIASRSPGGPVDPPLDPPSATAPPDLQLVSARLEEGAELYLSDAEWAWQGDNPVTQFRLMRSLNGTSGWTSLIAAQSSQTFVVPADQEGYFLRGEAQMTDSVGASGWVASNVLGPVEEIVVAPTPVANTNAPVLAGNSAIGSTITHSGDTWTGTPPITFEYRWQRQIGGGSWTTISGATSATYQTVSADGGGNVRLQKRGNNAAGTPTGWITSSNVIAVTAAAVAPTVATPVSVTPESGPVGTVFTIARATFNGTPAPTATLVLTQNGVNVTSQMVGNQFTSTAEGNLVATDTATNSAGSVASTDTSTVTAAGGVTPIAGTLTNPPVSARLGVLDGRTSRPFVNAFKQATEWSENNGPRGWDALVSGGFITATGQIIAIPSSGDPGIIARALYGLAEESGANGRWRLTWQGRGTVAVFGVSNFATITGNNGTANSNEVQFDYATGDAGTNIAIVFTSINAGGGNIRNIKLVHEDDWAADNAGQNYRQQYLDEIRNYRCIRFDEWMGILRTEEAGGLRVTTWASRALPADEMFSRRYVPYEWQVELCHLIGADGWFCLPTAATDDHFSNAATWFAANYNDPKRVLYVEYSTKTWDFAGTPQAHYVAEQGRIAFGTTGNPTQSEFVNWYGMRSTQMAQAFRAVWGNSARLKTVIQNQADDVGIAYDVLNSPMWQQRSGQNGLPVYVAPHTVLDVLTVHAQIDGGMAYNYNGEADLMESWRAGNSETVFFNMMRDQLLTAAHIYGSETNIRTVEMMLPKWEDFAEMADGYGMELAFYEVGNHLNGVLRLAAPNPTLLAALHRFSRSAQMGEVYVQTFEALQSLGATGPLCMAVECRYPDENIMHGLQAWLGDHNGAWTAVNALNLENNGPAGRGASDFVGTIEIA